MIISHLYKSKKEDKWVFQSNESHTKGVAELAARFADEFGMASWGRVLGMLHDKGKESVAFQQHIKKESGYDPYIKIVGDSHHAYVGAIVARNLYGRSSDNFFVNQIVSHHTGLHDSDELDECLRKEIPQEIDMHVDKIQLNRLATNIAKSDFHHFARMLYSCLVDADFLDTEAFMDKESSDLRNKKADLSALLPMLERYLAGLRNNETEVNRIRNMVQEQCVRMSESPVGFYSLTVPTGGGKTLSSLLWAMKHAIRNGQKRVVIAIPYTSIIMQTANVLREIFGKENVLEHHSNVDIEKDTKESDGPKERAEKYDELKERLKLASENWDYPIVVTTNVQLFESMFSNKPSKCRKLHNIVNSIIILDEVQTLPMDYLQPIVDSLKTYNKLFNVSVLLTTASQPVLSGIIEGCNPKSSFEGIDSITEIIPQNFMLHDKLRRVELKFDNEGKTYDEVATMLCKHKRVLCIVNTRKDAKELYERLPQEGITLHLSKMMCPAHIGETIEQMRTALADNKNEIIRVVSTQLVEAGVDIDFPVVYRQEAGLDSVLQAAGRCNREGKLDLCTTHVFSLSKEHNLPKGNMQAANAALQSLDKYSDWFAPDTMTSFFKQMYCRQNTFDRKRMTDYLYKPTENLYFATAAKEFQLIEDTGKNVIVCWNDSMGLIQQLLRDGPSYLLMKKLSKYSVNVYKNDFDALCDIGVVSEKIEGIYVVDYKDQYDDHIGLRIDNDWSNTSLIV